MAVLRGDDGLDVGVAETTGFLDQTTAQTRIAFPPATTGATAGDIDIGITLKTPKRKARKVDVTAAALGGESQTAIPDLLLLKGKGTH